MEETSKPKQPSLKDTKDSYHIFKVRDSYFDILIAETHISKSEFRGFYHLFWSLVTFYVISCPIVNYIEKGYFYRTHLFSRIVKDFLGVLLIWPLFYLWSYIAFFLQKLILRGLPIYLAQLIQHSSQSGIFIITTYVSLKIDVCTTHKIFILVQCMVHFLKMHSYTQINRDYRENYLQYKDTDPGKLISTYPHNLNFRNFFYFMRAPTFIYQDKYPMTDKFRFSYLAIKIIKAFIILFFLLNIYSDHIEPTIPHMLHYNFIYLITILYVPVCSWIAVCFLLIFECVLPAYAELCLFGDRQFYDDWWNSTDFEEFNRKWNKVVHAFLYRHIYLEFRDRFKFSSMFSKLITFLFSAALHEYVLIILFKVISPLMMAMMIFQIPVIWIGKKLLNNTTLGNYFFWFSLILGNTMIFIYYNRQYLLEYGPYY